MATPKKKKKQFRSKKVSHTEVKNRIVSMFRDKIPVTIWQGNNIVGALITNISAGSYQIVLKVDSNEPLNFSHRENIHLFGRGMLAQTSIVSTCNEQMLIRLVIPDPQTVRLTENRQNGRLDTVDTTVHLTLKTVDEAKVKFGMVLVNLSRQGIAARMPHGRDATFIRCEQLQMLGFGRSSFEAPITLTIGHITNNVNIKNYGPNNTVLGLQFSQILKKVEFIHLLEEINKA